MVKLGESAYVTIEQVGVDANGKSIRIERPDTGPRLAPMRFEPSDTLSDAVLREELRRIIVERDKACAERDHYREQCLAESEERIRSNNQKSDQLGALRTENDELLRENARLRRANERLERQAKGKR